MAETTVTRMVKQDLQRAEKIKDLVESARQHSMEARADLEEAVRLCEQDVYSGVKDYDAKDLKDIESMIRVAVTRPLNQLSARWWDILHGRRECLADKQ